MKFDELFIEDLGQLTDGMFGDGRQTSQAIGEEDDAPNEFTSMAIGEEDDAPNEFTSLAIGEE